MPPAPKEYLRRTSHRGGSVWISTDSTSPRRPFSILSLTLQTVRAGSFLRGVASDFSSPHGHRNQLQRFRRLYPFSILLYGGGLSEPPRGGLFMRLRNCASGRLRRMRPDRFRRDYRRCYRRFDRADDRRRDRGADDVIVEIVNHTGTVRYGMERTRCLTSTGKRSEVPLIDVFGIPMTKRCGPDSAWKTRLAEQFSADLNADHRRRVLYG